ncbi:hypothetical protein [Spirosoma validum]|uniref:Uncharacterized protein n=1 Tax=Spirosoma validum TaxID=2771355 RepID=A0A927GDQ1_9BACT|nr:hypothetical protein [Spirosoma validum]MBD2753806.1 hypothetical protein [Spirosoma validum]
MKKQPLPEPTPDELSQQVNEFNEAIQPRLTLHSDKVIALIERMDKFERYEDVTAFAESIEQQADDYSAEELQQIANLVVAVMNKHSTQSATDFKAWVQTLSVTN